MIASVLLFVAALGADPSLATAIPVNQTSVVRFASAEEGRRLLTKTDTYAAALSPFDRQAKTGSRQPVDTPAFLDHAGRQVLQWKPDERQRLARIVGRLAEKLAPFDLQLPATVLLVRTTGREESDAAYSRGAGIVLSNSQLTMSDGALERLVAHELFHVVSRNNPDLRRKLYAIVGFHPCREVPLPAELAARRITNPDAPGLDCWVELTVDGRPARCVPLLLADGPYQPDLEPSFFSYLQFRLLVVAGEGDDLRPVVRDGRPVLVDPRDAPDYLDRVGRNTGYIIHPEEVLADNFSFLVEGRTGLPNPEIPARIRDLLTSAPE